MLPVECRDKRGAVGSWQNHGGRMIQRDLIVLLQIILPNALPSRAALDNAETNEADSRGTYRAHGLAYRQR